jgi:UDP-N-acetylglucosamine--N-acetylmuramyl-(pentapeptide) pyrophosphoryl-undecaprenol N-acetylglucosamine transferase
MEVDLVQRKQIPFQAIPAAGVHGVGLRSLPGNLIKLGRGYIAARRILLDYDPHVLFFTGGYVAVPMAYAGRGWPGKRVPALLYVPDIEPGLALKTLARSAAAIAVTAEDSRKYFPGHRRVVVTGYPTRPELAVWDRQTALRTLGLKNSMFTLLVFGGSKGAQSINRALYRVLPDLLSEIQIVHISGQGNWSESEAARQNLDRDRAEHYHPYPYLHDEMGAALCAADLVVSRAGASVLGECPLFGLPAVLVPYPYAWRYQKVNADYLAQRGGAVVLADEDLAEQLLPAVLGLVNSPKKLERMQAAMKSLARPAASQEIAKLLCELAVGGGGNSLC